jgi:splicing factor 3A subunit 2
VVGVEPPETGVEPPETGVEPPETGVEPPETGVDWPVLDVGVMPLPVVLPTAVVAQALAKNARNTRIAMEW